MLEMGLNLGLGLGLNCCMHRVTCCVSVLRRIDTR
jgi:hypothetical protein